MPLPNPSLVMELNYRWRADKLLYDTTAEKEKNMQFLMGLNAEQKLAYDSILQSIENNEGRLFFVYSHGGTFKTYLWNAVISKLRSESKIVLVVATSGIAALILPAGRTVHSRFHLPLSPNGESICDIKKNKQVIVLIQKKSLIIWDKAPMANKYCFEALDKSLRDLLLERYLNSKEQPFGGMTVVLGGDFR